MPIKRRLAKDNFNTEDRIVSMARDSVRLIKHPLSDEGWQTLICEELHIDIETSIRIFKKLIIKGVLLYVRTLGKRSIYMNDRTPEFKRYMWSGD